MGESRHNPDQLLKGIQADEENLRHVRSGSYGKTAGN